MQASNFLVHTCSGDVVMAESQFFPGYCLLIATPRIESLNELPFKQRNQFLSDMSVIGDIITQICQPKRINYAILGNKDPYLHAHIIPRYTWEEPNLQQGSVWSYPPEYLNASLYGYTEEKHGELKQLLIKHLRLQLPCSDPLPL